MSRTPALLMTAVLSLLVVALAACGSEEKATQTPAAATSATQAASPTQPGHATASVQVGDKTSHLANGECAKGPDDAWLAVSIGQVGSADYFLLVVGNTAGQEGARSTQGGGIFTDGEITFVAGAQGGTTFLMGSSGDDKVTLAADLLSGGFAGTSTNGEPMSGSFTC